MYVGIISVRDVFTAPFSNDYVKWVFYLILMGITSFLLMRYLTQEFYG